MDSHDEVRIYSDSCPPLKNLLRQLRNQSAQRLGLSLIPLERGYAPGVWKRLFLITLNRMAKTQPSLARLTAVEALRTVQSSAGSNGRHLKTAAPRALLSKLKAMERQAFRGLTSPRKGFHPADLNRWKSDALHVFQFGIDENAATDLWKKCGGSGRRIPPALLMDLKKKRTTNARAMAFLAHLTGADEHVLRATMFRQNRLVNL